jgi:signal transduction histidine kinase/ActR/RegA family two-component response regulator
MRPMKVRTHLLLLTLGSLVPLVVLAAAASWMLATGAPVLAREMIVLIAVGTLGAIALSALLSIQLARRISGPLAWVTATVKALRTSDPVDRPATAIRVREVDEASRALAEAVQAARARETSLRRADRVKDEFFAMLSHELRNPLGALAAASQILGRTGATDPAASQAIEVVARQVEQMTRLVEDLLDISRVTRGKLSLTRRPVNLAEVTEAAVRAMHASGQLDRHELRLELSTAWVHADEARLAQIVSNLVGNAVKFTPEAGEITVRVQREGQTALLRVKDSGIGMSPELAQRVFDLFVQGEQSRGGGLGIGLTLVKHLAELQGGQAFAASSGPGQGSVFTVSLPVTETSATVQVRPAAQPKRSRHRIVLIEDNEDARRTLMTALSMDGHEVFEAADGDAGIRTVEQVNPDVAIVDVGLPGLNGYQVAQRLRAGHGDDNMVLIALTGFGQPDSLRRAHEAGFDEYVTKPIAPERLVRLMDVALAARVRRRSTPGIPTLNSPSARA